MANTSIQNSTNNYNLIPFETDFLMDCWCPNWIQFGTKIGTCMDSDSKSRFIKKTRKGDKEINGLLGGSELEANINFERFGLICVAQLRGKIDHKSKPKNHRGNVVKHSGTKLATVPNLPL